ncbi:MAG: hypothetical protein ACTH31_16200 [Pseudoclavibacter sp.]
MTTRSDSPFYATISQDWLAVNDQLLEHMETYRTSAELPGENFVALDPELVDRSNADEFEPVL